MVLLKGFDAARLRLLHQLREPQGPSSSLAHPKAALLFHWKSLRRQVRVEGPVTPTTRRGGRRLFRDPRPRQPDRRLGLATSRGRWSAVRAGEARRRITRQAIVIGKVPRPPYWSGFRLQPRLIEFWQDGAFRLHDRLEYRRPAPDAPWTTRTLYP